MGEIQVTRLEWYGDRVTAAVVRATRFGMDSVMASCVSTAKSMVPRKTSVLQGSIQMRPTMISGVDLVGYWGSFGVKYALWVEQGTRPHVILPKTRQALYWPGADHPVRMVYHPGTKSRPYLIPAAQQHYPSLALRIKAELEWGGQNSSAPSGGGSLPPAGPTKPSRVAFTGWGGWQPI